MASYSLHYELSSEDLLKLQLLEVPIPNSERERIKILRQANLLDSDPNDLAFDRLTRLASRIFKVNSNLFVLIPFPFLM
jgi:hypothetical protein